MTQETSTEGKYPDPYQENRLLVDDICGGCCAPNKYCTLKEILIRSPKDVRTMVQIKCIEKFKYERSSAAGKDIGWGEAHAMWIREGLAEGFAKMYRRGTSVNTLYASILKSIQTPTPTQETTSVVPPPTVPSQPQGGGPG